MVLAMDERLEVELDDNTLQVLEEISKAEGISVEDFMKKAVIDFANSGKSIKNSGVSSTTTL